MNIAGREIGAGGPPYVIAEIGVNHDGSVDRAVELVHASAQAGADAVKLQLFKADLLLSKAARLATYQRESGAKDPFSMLRAVELSIEQMVPIVACAHDCGIHAIVSIFSVPLVEMVRGVGFDAIKVASPDVVNHPLLRAMAHLGLPMIVSTGAADADEVVLAADVLRDVRDLAFLHCVSAYPTPETSANLAGIAAVADLHRDGRIDRPFAVGYSDHTTSIEIGSLAVAAGAVILEKHVTYDRNAPGPDHHASLEPAELSRYIQGARRAALMLGDRCKAVSEIERDVRRTSRQSITTARDLPAGHRIKADDLTIKRPGTGLPPGDLERVIGRKTSVAVGADVPVTNEMLT
ncbi:MAG: N-acetylneuraminate synthase family protein [Phycisphaerales bacterium]|nr:N-acetylneuraminate synthase family protein [Phycisphaerales bacterium]